MRGERHKRAAERLMHRRVGMTAEQKEALNAHNANKADWWARCRLCGERVYGTLEELEAHHCHGT